jgi:hypothetical protein
MVHDILYEKQNNAWVQKVSAYPKLRLTEKIVTNLLSDYNLQIIKSETINGLIHLIGQKAY